MLINKETSCSTAESYRKLRTNIKYLFKDKSLKSIGNKYRKRGRKINYSIKFSLYFCKR